MAGSQSDHDTAPFERLKRYQEILADFSRVVGEAREIKRLLQIACVQIARGIGIRNTKIMRYRPENGDLLIEAGVGWKPGVVGCVAVGTDIASPAGRALQTRQPVVVGDLPNSAAFRYTKTLQDHGIVSLVNVPVPLDGGIWGVLEVDSDVPRHFSEADVKFLGTMANILGVSLYAAHQDELLISATTDAKREVERYKLLIRELNHRDKNDFQLVMALLLLQKDKVFNDEAKQALTHIADRVSTISMAHDQLATATTPKRGTIRLASYLQALCGNLNQRRDDVRVEAYFANVELIHERAIPLGLVTNELVTNAIKHAFPDKPGTITVRLGVSDDGYEGILEITDDGVGMGPARPGSSGLSLVNGLVAQVGGKLEQRSAEAGTTFLVTFPLVQ